LPHRSSSATWLPRSGQEGIGLLVALAACLGTGALGGWATASSVNTWYPTLDKPAFTPSGTLISTVWTVLFVLMAIAVWRVWQTEHLDAEPGPITLFVGQLVLNLGWSLVFFGLQSPGLALLEILVLEAAVVATAWRFGDSDRWAGYLMVPYAVWVAFATVLNATIWWMNRAG
jgi:tryptophan-rich sensory protein